MFLDEKNIGVSPLSVHVEPGNHSISFRLDGYEEFKEVVTVPEEGLSFLEPLKAIPGWVPPPKKETGAQASDNTQVDKKRLNTGKAENPKKKPEGLSADDLVVEAKSQIDQGDGAAALRTIKKMVLYFPNDGRIDALFQLASSTSGSSSKKDASAPKNGSSQQGKAKSRASGNDKSKATASKGQRSTASTSNNTAPASNKKQGAKQSYQEGERLVRQMQYKRAKEAFKEAIRLDPTFYMPHRSIARIYERENNIRQTKYHLQRYLRLGGPDQDRRVKSWIETH